MRAWVTLTEIERQIAEILPLSLNNFPIKEIFIMFMVLEDTILNMDHVSRIFIEVYQTDNAVVKAEYAPPICFPPDNSTFPKPNEFQIELCCGTEETCKQFLAGLNTMLESDSKSVTIKPIMKEKAFTGYKIKGIDGDNVPREYETSSPYTVFILLEAVADDNWGVAPGINSYLKKIWIERFNQLASDTIKQYKNTLDSSAYPSGIEYYKDEDYEAFKVYDTNFETIMRWKRVLKNLVEDACKAVDLEVSRMKRFKAAADDVSTKDFTES